VSQEIPKKGALWGGFLIKELQLGFVDHLEPESGPGNCGN
jgi:hypothetical protein